MDTDLVSVAEPVALSTGPAASVYCRALELVAFAIHPGDTESTTSLCIVPSQKKIYVTSQANYAFADVSVQSLHDVLDGLAARLADPEPDQFWLDHCRLAEAREYRTKKAALAGAKKIDRLYNDLFKPLFKVCVQTYDVPTLTKLKSLFTEVQVIQTKDLFSLGNPTTTGLHGEGRIVRYLYIFFAGHFRELFIEEEAWYEAEEDLEERGNQAMIWQHFKTTLEATGSIMGSSQATCQACGRYLDDLKIAHGPVGNRSPNWCDPITLTSYQGETVSHRGKYYHAFHFHPG